VHHPALHLLFRMSLCVVSLYVHCACHGELSFRDVTLCVTPRGVSIWAGSPFPAENTAWVPTLESMLCLCGCVLHRTGGCPLGLGVVLLQAQVLAVSVGHT